jgi:cytidylate kinase
VEISSEICGEKVVFFVNGQDVTQHLNDELINKSVSIFSQHPHFRAVLLGPLRSLAERFPLIMEGRDIGSVVFPQTPYKFYLDASEEERERRRLAQGITDTVRSRDQLDSARPVAPLVVPLGAHVIDAGCLTLEEVVDEFLKILKEKNFPVSPS